MSLVVGRVLVGSVFTILTACAASHGGEDEPSSTLGVQIAAEQADACAGLPPLDGAATTVYQSDTVAHLAGVADVLPGVRLADRASPANRQIARDYLTRHFEDLRLTPLLHAYGTGTNVYAELPSTSGGVNGSCSAPTSTRWHEAPAQTTTPPASPWSTP